jgi:PKD repeat protein
MNSWEETKLKGKILALLVSLALLVGMLSGCVEEEKEEENTAPEASFTWEAVGLTVTFTDTSDDADDDTLTYSWDFGDTIGTSVETSPVYVYNASGTYTVTLIVNDSNIDSNPFTDEVTVTNPPTVTLEIEPENITNATEVTFTATATAGDAEINETTGYTWYIDDVMQENETTSTFAYTFEDGTYTGEDTLTITVPT